jgi:hypothetical protein
MLTGRNGGGVTVTSGGGVVMGSDGLSVGRPLVFVLLGLGVLEVAGARDVLRLAAIWRDLAATAAALPAMVPGWATVVSELPRGFEVAPPPGAVVSSEVGGAAPVEPGPKPPNGARWSPGTSQKAAVPMVVTRATLPAVVATAGAALRSRPRRRWRALRRLTALLSVSSSV